MRIVRHYGLKNRSTVYRHARRLNLFRKRARNLRAPLERLLEQASDVKPSAAAIVAAVQVLAKLNARGEWIERDERVALDDLFDRMTPQECGAYAKDGTLPNWFRQEIAAAAGRVPDGDDNHE